MTSCLLAKAPDRIVVVADGRLSVSDAAVSFDTAEKIIRFTPTYRIPRIDRGRFARYSDRTIADWCIAYAGNVALASEIHRLFISRVTKGLFLTWTEGKATLEESFHEGAEFGDYDFENADLIPLTPEFISGCLKRIASVKCDEFAMNRGEFPDCEFLLFGRDEVTTFWTAFKLYADDAGWRPGRTASLILDNVPDGQLAAIGSRHVAGEAYADGGLNAGLEGWRVNQSKNELDEFLDGFDLDGPFSPPAPSTNIHDPRNWTLPEVRRRFADHIREASDPAVGGNILIAAGGYYGDLVLRAG